MRGKSSLLHRLDFVQIRNVGFAFRGTKGVRGEPNSPLNPSGLPHPSVGPRGCDPLGNPPERKLPLSRFATAPLTRGAKITPSFPLEGGASREHSVLPRMVANERSNIGRMRSGNEAKCWFRLRRGHCVEPKGTGGEPNSPPGPLGTPSPLCWSKGLRPLGNPLGELPLSRFATAPLTRGAKGLRRRERP